MGFNAVRSNIKECVSNHETPEPPLCTKTTCNTVVQYLRRYGLYKGLKNDTILRIMKTLSIPERDRISFEAENGPPFYFGAEVPFYQNLEEKAVLRALPIKNHNSLNGINIGAGGRKILNSLPIDAHRMNDEKSMIKDLPKSQKNLKNTLLAWADNLPFANNTLDYIVSLHNLEHLQDPVKAIHHYLDILKPGGGIGIVIPHYKYAWPPRNDNSIWGHRWETSPTIICELYYKYWKSRSNLEHLNTYRDSGALSFDFVLRKHGVFSTFNTNQTTMTGKELAQKSYYARW